MYRFIKNKYLRNFIIIFSLISCISLGYKQEKVQAIAIVDDALAIGSVLVAPEVVGALAIAGIAYAGYKVVDSYKEDVKNFVVSKLAKKGMEKYFKHIVSKNGEEYVSFTNDGLNKVQEITKEAINSKDTIPIDFQSNNNSFSYKVNDFIDSVSWGGTSYKIKYFRLADVLTNDMLIGCYLLSGPTIFGYKTSSGSSHTRLYEGSEGNPVCIRVRYSHSIRRIYFDKGSLYSDVNNDSTWNIGYEYINVSNRENPFFGIQVDAPVASFLPGSFVGNAVQGLASDQVGTGNVVAVPISGQYENSSGSKVYGIDGAVGEVSGLGSDTSTDTSTDIDVGSGVNQGWLDKILTGINSIGDNVASAIQDVPILGDIFKILSKIWTWAENLVGDIANVFKGWLDEIISLLKSILSALTGFVTSLLDGLLSMLKSLFIPDSAFFDNNFNDLKMGLTNKLGYEQYIKIFDTSEQRTLKDITITWNGKEIVVCKLTTFEYFRELFNSICYGFMFFGLAIYNYNQIYRIFRNNSYAKMAQTISRAKGE